jgi:hypothetical protein
MLTETVKNAALLTSQHTVLLLRVLRKFWCQLSEDGEITAPEFTELSTRKLEANVFVGVR